MRQDTPLETSAMAFSSMADIRPPSAPAQGSKSLEPCLRACMHILAIDGLFHVLTSVPSNPVSIQHAHDLACMCVRDK